MPLSNLRTLLTTAFGPLLFMLVAFTAAAEVRLADGFDTPRTLIVVDDGVADADLLLPTGGDAMVLRIASSDDALQAIADVLESTPGIEALHMLSHGAPGGVWLGGAWLDEEALVTRATTLQAIRERLADGADVLFWGCDVAAGERGRAFVDRFAELTGTQAAASASLVGNSELGGNWSLEYATGSMTASTPFSADGMNSYAHVLTHGRGGSITWQPIYDDNGALDYVEVTMKSGWRANWGQNPVFFTPNVSPSLTLVRQSAETIWVNGTDENDADYFLQTDIFHVDAAAIDVNTRYTVNVSICCRISNLVNNADARQGFQGEIYLRDGNLAPKIDLPIIFQVPQQNADGSRLENWTFRLQSSDPNADNLRYRLATPTEFSGGFNENTPQTNPQGLSINPNTGLITWTGSGDLSPGLYSAGFVAEDLDENGNRKSKTHVDLILELVDQAQTAFEVPGVSETRKVFVRKGESYEFDIENDIVSINSQALGDLQGTLTNPDGNTYRFEPGAEGDGLPAGTYPITFEIRAADGATSHNYLVLNFVVPDERAPWVEHIEGLRTVYSSMDEFQYIGDPDAPAELTYTDAPTLEGGALRVNVTFVDGEFEVLGLGASTEVSVVEGDVYYQGNVIGVVHPVFDGVGRAFHIDFTTEFATVEAVQAVIRNLVYRDTFELRQPGDRNLSLFIRDANGRSNNYDFFVYVEPHPDAPEAGGPPVMASNRVTIVEGETSALSSADINFVSPSGGEVTLSVDSISHGRFEYVSAPGSAITSFTQDEIALGAIAFAHDGSRNPPAYTLVASTADGAADPSAGSITFTYANLHAPEISGDPATVAVAGQPYAFTPDATDEDLDFGDYLEFSITNRPSWASFDSETGELSGTPGAGDLGDHAGIVITVVDQGGLNDSLPAFTINVRAVSGAGTSEDPYVVDTPLGLGALADHPDSYFVIDSDVDLSGADWAPVGTEGEPFTGVLRGEWDTQPTITGLAGHALFGHVGPGATIENIRLVGAAYDAGIESGGLLADRIAGTEVAPVTVSNVHIDGGSVSGGNATGGLAGHVSWAEFTDVSSSASVSGAGEVGGLVGRGEHLTLNRVHASGDVSGTGAAVGGLVGRLANSTPAGGVYATGDVEGADQVGGLVGVLDGSGVSTGYATGAVSADAGFAGGLIGSQSNGSWVSQVYSIGAVDAPGGTAGGLVGSADAGDTATSAYWNTTTSGVQTSANGEALDSEQMIKRDDNDAETNYSEFFIGSTQWDIAPGVNAGYPSFFWSSRVEVAVEVDGSGSIDGAGWYPVGSRALLFARAESDHALDGQLTASCTGDPVGDDGLLLKALYAQCTVEATFERSGYTVSASAEPGIGGSISGAGVHAVDSEVVLTAQPLTGYVFVHWAENGNVVSTEREYAFDLTGSRELVAHFEYVPLEVTDADGQPIAGDISVPPGTAYNFSLEGTGSFDVSAEITRGGEGQAVSGSNVGEFLVDLGGGDYRFEAPRSGRYELTFTDAGTSLAQTLSLIAYPQISFASAYQVGAPGSEVAVRAVLDDLPVDQSASVTWQTAYNSLAEDLADEGTLEISAETRTQTLRFTPLASSGDIILEMLESSLVGARMGSHSVHTVELRDRLPMRADLQLRHQDEPRSIVVTGTEGLQSRLVDIPTGDYSYDWSSSDPALSMPADGGAEVSFTAPDAAGTYTVRVTVTDTTDGTRQVSAESRFVAVSADAIATLCPDGDCTDSNGNGILDALDQCSIVDEGGTPFRLQVSAGSNGMMPVCLETTAGYMLRLGRVSLPAGHQGAGVQADDIRTHGRGDGQSALNADDAAYNHLSQHVDFELIGLDAPGQAAMVVVPLMTAIPEGAVWRKYHADDGWFTFSTEGENALHSASVNSSGDCPAPGSAGWTAGLNAGDDCVRLTIVDGGFNDVDREANGVIRDPGVLAVANGDRDDDTGQAPPDTTPPADMVVTSGGGGGSVGLVPLLFGALLFGAAAVRRHWRRIAAVAALAVAFPLAAQSASPDEGWYAGAQVGQVRGDTGSGDVNSALAARGIDGEADVSRRNRVGGRAFVGYRVNRHLAVEGGYAELGKARTTLVLDEAVPLEQLRGTLPASGRGVEATLLGILPLGPDFEGFVRGGAWHAKARYRVDSGNERTSSTSTSAVYGLGVEYRALERLGLRVSADRYRLSGQDLTLFAVGANYRF